MNIIDPRTINPINSPKLVFVNSDTFISDLIKLREDGSWGITGEVSHMMTMTLPGLFNCMEMGLPGSFQQVPVTSYMKKGIRMVFIDFVNMNPQAYQAMCMVVSERLGKIGYDWLQIIGQATGLSFLHMPGTEDCSEESVREMKAMAPFLPSDTALINSLNNQSNPQQVLQFCLNNPKSFSLFGACQF